MQDMNLSRQKREELIDICNQMRDKSPEDAANINRIIQFIKDQKYGLQFEKHQEQVDIDLLTKIPVFTEDKSKKITSDASKPYNFLLEGDNLHSLKLLEKTHHGAIDVIYIDPPYNTGSEFVYNDKIISKDDGYRHSKWLSFMKERLDIAYKLLNANGAMFISIDDNEYANLKILCDAIAGESNVETLIWNTIAEGNSGNMKQVHRVRNVHEYIIIVYKDKVSTYFNKINEALAHITSLQTTNLAKNNANKRGDKERIFPITNPQNGLSWTDEWKYSKDEVERLQKEGLLHFGKDGKNKPRQILPTDDRRSVYLQTIVNKGSTTVGRKDLENVLGRGLFDNPKPLTLIKTLIRLHQNNNATVLDFFAGSGTTGHAVLELNKEDGGNRKFILCTNNEANICEEITYQRIKTVITGVRADGSAYSSDIPANLKYFKTDFVERNTDIVPDELAQHCSEMIELQHGINVDTIGVFDAKNILLKNDDEADLLYENFSNYQNLEAIYIIEDTNECDSVILTNAQLDKFKNIPIISVPRWYFENEIMEAK